MSTTSLPHRLITVRRLDENGAPIVAEDGSEATETLRLRVGVRLLGWLESQEGGWAGIQNQMAERPLGTLVMAFSIMFGWDADDADARLIISELERYVEAFGLVMADAFPDPAKKKVKSGKPKSKG